MTRRIACVLAALACLAVLAIAIDEPTQSKDAILMAEKKSEPAIKEQEEDQVPQNGTILSELGVTEEPNVELDERELMDEDEDEEENAGQTMFIEKAGSAKDDILFDNSGVNLAELKSALDATEHRKKTSGDKATLLEEDEDSDDEVSLLEDLLHSEDNDDEVLKRSDDASSSFLEVSDSDIDSLLKDEQEEKENDDEERDPAFAENKMLVEVFKKTEPTPADKLAEQQASREKAAQDEEEDDEDEN
eukprot:TRINITY_DN612_c0_g1_i1.p1 TRINITY_DN612_c0_g1~~TRINITY_DN612_c0_g1_i1.p1  ORF type:complete len:247 (+),score=107.78 TRINITY_DN612_c0_g1_i1:181-921(+)